MAVEASARLRHDLLAQRVLLVLQHVSVATLLAKVRGNASPATLSETDILVDL